MSMSKERMLEIAIMVLVAKIEKDGGLELGLKLRRELGDLAKKTGIPLTELEEFSKVVVVRLIGRTYGMQNVGIVMTDPVKPRPETEVVEL